jgi:CRP-like cAMP-binding protein
LSDNAANHEPGTLSAALDVLLRQHARRRQLERGEQLYARGSPPDALFCVEQGIVRLSVTSAGGREAVLGLVSKDQWFGEASLFGGEPRGNDAIAIVKTTVLLVPTATIHKLVDHHPDYLLQFLTMMGRRYRAILTRMDDTALRPLPARLARVILQAHDRETRTSGQAEALTLRFSQEEVGHMLGASRQSINRLLKLWEQDGVVSTGYRSLKVRRPDALQAMCDLEGGQE